MYLAGGGIIAHPGGAAAGVAAIRQAWEAAVAGEPLERFAQTHHELAQSLDHSGGRSRRYAEALSERVGRHVSLAQLERVDRLGVVLDR